jgi:hypothetical protein
MSKINEQEFVDTIRGITDDAWTIAKIHQEIEEKSGIRFEPSLNELMKEVGDLIRVVVEAQKASGSTRLPDFPPPGLERIEF